MRTMLVLGVLAVGCGGSSPVKMTSVDKGDMSPKPRGPGRMLGDAGAPDEQATPDATVSADTMRASDASTPSERTQEPDARPADAVAPDAMASDRMGDASTAYIKASDVDLGEIGTLAPGEKKMFTVLVEHAGFCASVRAVEARISCVGDEPDCGRGRDSSVFYLYPSLQDCGPASPCVFKLQAAQPMAAIVVHSLVLTGTECKPPPAPIVTHTVKLTARH